MGEVGKVWRWRKRCSGAEVKKELEVEEEVQTQLEKEVI